MIAYLQNDLGHPAARLSAAGYGEFHPRVANTTRDGARQNRRVDLVILNGATSAAEEPHRALSPAGASTPPARRARRRVTRAGPAC